MSYIYFIADCHFGHSAIIKYCNRPFKDIETMNKVIIHNWNKRVKKDDVVIHNGDFAFEGGKQGGTRKAKYWGSQLNGKIIFMEGNHKASSIKDFINSMIIKFAGKRIFVTHIPPKRKEIPKNIDFVLSAHSHEKYKYKWIKTGWFRKKILIINVGVDVWNFKPVRLDELYGFYLKKLKENKDET